MPTDVKVDFSGMVTAPGVLARARASTSFQENAHVPAPGVMRKRLGYSNREYRLPSGCPKAVYSDALTGDSMFVHGGVDLTASVMWLGDGNTPWLVVQPIPNDSIAPTQDVTRSPDERMQFVRANNVVYATADQGVVRIGTPNDPTILELFAGMPRGFQPDIWASKRLNSHDTLIDGTLLQQGEGRAYRVTFHLIEPNSTQELGGAPTGRTEVENISGYPGYTGAARAVSLRVYLPFMLSSVDVKMNLNQGTWICKIWGTRIYQTVPVNTEDDEMFLIAEKTLSQDNINDGFFTYTDLAPDAFITRRQYLHTNTQFLSDAEAGESITASGKASGVLNEDAPPPASRAMAFWRGRMWYGNVKYRSRFSVRMVSLPDPGDTVTVTGPTGSVWTFTASNSPSGLLQFQRFTSFPTLMENIRATALALCEIINYNMVFTGFTIQGAYAYYTSTSLANAGNIYFEALPMAVGTTGFQLRLDCSNPVVFEGLTTTTSVFGTDDATINGVAFSKVERADACPPAFTFFIGGRQEVILKMIPLKERLFVFTDQGVYTITGYGPQDFAVRRFSPYRLIGQEMAAAIDERILGWCREGIIEFSEGGTEIISLPIDTTVRNIIAAGGAGSTIADSYALFARNSFAVASPDNHRVDFYFPRRGGFDSRLGCAHWLSWDTRTRTWSQNQFGRNGDALKSCGVARFDGAVVLGAGFPRGGTPFTGRFVVENIYLQGSTDFQDYLDTGVDSPVVFRARFQWDIPQVDGAVHWQQMVLQFENANDGGPITGALPSTVSANWYTDQSWAIPAASGVYPLGGASPLVRIELPLGARRSNRLFTEIVNDVAESFALVAVSHSLRGPAKFARRANNS